MRKIIFRVAFIFAIAAALSSFGCIPNTNDFYEYRFANQLFSCPAPDSVLVLEQVKLMGKLVGEGDGMDFAAVLLVQTNMNMTNEDLLSYYSSFDFVPAKNPFNLGERMWSNDYVHSLVIAIEEVKNAFWRSDFSRSTISFESKMNYEKYRYYAIILFDGGYVAGLDMRGC